MPYNALAEFLLNLAVHSTICFGVAALIDRFWRHTPRAGLWKWNVAALAAGLGALFPYLGRLHPVLAPMLSEYVYLNQSIGIKLAEGVQVSSCVAGLITWVWFGGAIAGTCAWLYQMRHLRVIFAQRQPCNTPHLLGLAEECRRLCGLQRSIRVSTHPTLKSPIAIGTREICLPEHTLGMDPLQLKAILGHELCHLSRHDPLTIPLLDLVRRIFWFQPLGKLFLRSRQHFVEQICDSWGSRCAGSPQPMASALITIATGSGVWHPGLPSLGAKSGAPLSSRVSRILECKSPSFYAMASHVAIITICVCATLILQKLSPIITMTCMKDLESLREKDT